LLRENPQTQRSTQQTPNATMPSRRQNPRRWRRLGWQEVREGIQDPPAIEEPFEAPSPAPMPEAIEVQAQLVPSQSEPMVITAEVLAEPETRIQYVTNPEQKKKIQELAKENQKVKHQNQEIFEELSKQGDLNAHLTKVLKMMDDKSKKRKKETKDELKRMMDDAENVNDTDMSLVKYMSKWGASMGHMTITIIWGHDKNPAMKYCDTVLTNTRENYYGCATTHQKEQGFFWLRAGTWANLKLCYKYFLMDKTNYWWANCLSVGLKERVCQTRMGCVEIEAIGKYCCEIANGNISPDKPETSMYAPELFFTLICDAHITERTEKEGIDVGPNGPWGIGNNMWEYFKKQLDDENEKSLNKSSWNEDGSDQDAEEKMKWEEAKNSIINL
jgi:hypothetical protein